MRLIATALGNAVIRVSSEDVRPRNGVAWPELIAALNARYKFTSTSPIPATVPSPPQWVIFHGGELDAQDTKLAIQQITITSSGAVVTAVTTETADKILDDLVSFLDKSFEFRIAASKFRRSCISEVVVEFERGIEDYLQVLAQIESLINQSLPGSGSVPFRIKRIAFGREGFDAGELMIAPMNPLDAFDTVEFVIERRTKHAYDENRYFSRAPFATEKHLAALETIEKMLAGSRE